MTCSDWIRVALVVMVTLCGQYRQAEGAHFIFGGEARRVCEAYKLICPVKKVCALQSIEWPRPMKFPVCVHESQVVVKSNICRKPPSPGRCRAQFMRWYFNVHMGTCSWFTYSGCGGNQNKFRTVEECERRCMGTGVIKGGSDDLRFGHMADVQLFGSHHQQQVKDTGLNNGTLTYEEKNQLEEGPWHRPLTVEAQAPRLITLNNDVVASMELSRLPKESHKKTGKRSKKQQTTTPESNETGTKRRKNKKLKKPKKSKKSSHHSRKDNNMPVLKTSSLITDVFNKTNQSPEGSQFLALTGPKVTISHFGKVKPEDRVWAIDTFKKTGRKHKNRLNNPEDQPRIITPDSHSGARQDSYYDKVKLFDILKKQGTGNKSD